MRTICSMNSGIPDNIQPPSPADNLSHKAHNNNSNKVFNNNTMNAETSKSQYKHDNNENNDKNNEIQNKKKNKTTMVNGPDSGREFAQLNREVLPDASPSPPVDYIKLPATETILKLLKSYLERYREFVKFNPILISDVESALYWVSYLLSTTRFYNSRIISELLYSCSSLLRLVNDTLLRKAYNIHPKINPQVDTLQTSLTFIEYLQVFLELAAYRLYGTFGKWIVISLVEIIKATIRLVLLFYFDQGITKKSYVVPFNRLREFERYRIRQECSDQDNKASNAERLPIDDKDQYYSDGEQENIMKDSFQLDSSGRIIRKLENAPNKSQRFWLTPVQSQRLKRLLRKQHRYHPSITPLNRQRLFGEVLHIIRPLAHLGAGALTRGVNKWTPYLLAFGIDIMSLKFLQGDNFLLSRPNLINLVLNSRKRKSTVQASGAAANQTSSSSSITRIPFLSGTAVSPAQDYDPVEQVWNWSEQVEIQRRYLSLFMYLLRSPFYDRFTKEKLLRTLSFFANYIPIFGRLIRPFISYLPEWQRIYFYNWTQ